MAVRSSTLLVLLMHCVFAAVTSQACQGAGDSSVLQSAVSQFNVIRGVIVTNRFSSISSFLNVDVYTCAAKCMWSPSCGGFNFLLDYVKGLTTCELTMAISGPKFVSVVSQNASNDFYYKKCPSSYTNYSPEYETYYYLFNPYPIAGINANQFCAKAGLQLLQNRNYGELQYIWNNVYQGHIWLNTFSQGTAYWANDGDRVDFSISSPGGSRCAYAAGRECITTSNAFNSQWCADVCTYTYASVICTCYDYAKLLQ